MPSPLDCCCAGPGLLVSRNKLSSRLRTRLKARRVGEQNSNPTGGRHRTWSRQVRTDALFRRPGGDSGSHYPAVFE
jgi:hypothetical protein